MTERNEFDIPTTAIGIHVREEALSHGLGYYRPSEGQIVIHTDQPRVGKHITFLHEILHATETTMRKAGVIKRRVDHNFIENAAYNLLLALVATGFWPSLTIDDLASFDAENPPEHERTVPPLRDQFT